MVGGQRHALAASPREEPALPLVRTVGWVGPRTGLDEGGEKKVSLCLAG